MMQDKFTSVAIRLINNKLPTVQGSIIRINSGSPLIKELSKYPDMFKYLKDSSRYVYFEIEKNVTDTGNILNKIMKGASL